MKVLPFGKRLPEVGDTSDTIFDALENNIQVGDRHTHNGIDSPFLTLNNLHTPTIVIKQSEWTGPGRDGLFTITKRLPQGIDPLLTPIIVTEYINGCHIISNRVLAGSSHLNPELRLSILQDSQVRIDSRTDIDNLVLWFMGRRQDDVGTFGASLVFATGWAPTKDRAGLSTGVNNANSVIGGALGRRYGSTGTSAPAPSFYFIIWPKTWGFLHEFEFAGQLGSNRFERIGTVSFSGTEFWGIISASKLQIDIDYKYSLEGNGDSGAISLYRHSGIGTL